MNRDDIIRMALEAGIDAESDTLCRYEGWVEPLERFFHAAYAAGAAAERQRIAAEWDWHMYGDTEDIDIGAAIRARSNP